jgi:hypothetical protein
MRKLERRLIAARIIARGLTDALAEGDLDEARRVIYHLRFNLKNAGRLLDDLEETLDPPLAVFSGRRRFTAPDDLP